jgi:SOS-response transcriptional repressor LexA
VVALVDNDGATVKRFFLRKDHVERWPENKKTGGMDSEGWRSRENEFQLIIKATKNQPISRPCPPLPVDRVQGLE